MESEKNVAEWCPTKAIQDQRIMADKWTHGFYKMIEQEIESYHQVIGQVAKGTIPNDKKRDGVHEKK